MNIQELQTERLDINNKYNVELVCKQLDDVILKIIVYDKSLPADLSNYNVRLKAFKADQVPLIQDANITITDNVVTIKASKQLTTTSGIVKAELQFINKTTLEKKSTFYLEIEVVASVLIDKNIVSTPTCTLLEELDNKLDEIENIGNVLEEAKVVRDTLKNTTIPIGTTLKSDLDTNITTGTQLKTDLTELIPKVEKSKSDLDASKTNADLSNKTLIETTNNAEIKKQEVVEECKVADEKIKKMNEFGDVSEISKDINLIKTEITTARDNETDLNTRLEEDKTNILNKFNDYAKKDGTLQSNLNAEMLGGLKIKDFQKVYGGITYDFNTTLTQGEYQFDLNTLNQPNDYKNYGKLIVFVNDGGTHNNVNNWIWQIMYPTNSSIGIWYRNKTNKDVWSPWKELATTERPQEFQITGLNGFSSVSGSKATYFKTQDGVVNINAYLQSFNPLNGNELLIFNLPLGYRPNNAIRVIGMLNSSSGDINKFTEVIIYPNGEVKFKGTNVYAIYFNVSFLGVN